MEINELQNKVDTWIRRYGVRYFDEKTNMLLLMEEMGELSRLMARKFGEQSFKEPISDEDIKNKISDEFGDVLFVLTCLANQMELNIEDIMTKNIKKKTLRDSRRHISNPKLTQ